MCPARSSPDAVPYRSAAEPVLDPSTDRFNVTADASSRPLRSSCDRQPIASLGSSLLLVRLLLVRLYLVSVISTLIRSRRVEPRRTALSANARGVCPRSIGNFAARSSTRPHARQRECPSPTPGSRTSSPRRVPRSSSGGCHHRMGRRAGLVCVLTAGGPDDRRHRGGERCRRGRRSSGRDVRNHPLRVSLCTDGRPSQVESEQGPARSVPCGFSAEWPRTLGVRMVYADAPEPTSRRPSTVVLSRPLLDRAPRRDRGLPRVRVAERMRPVRARLDGFVIGRIGRGPIFGGIFGGVIGGVSGGATRRAGPRSDHHAEPIRVRGSEAMGDRAVPGDADPIDASRSEPDTTAD